MVINRLPQILRQKGVSIRELSRQTGITYTTVRAVYHGNRRSVQLSVMDSLCRVLEIQPGEIYKYYPDESAASVFDSKFDENTYLIEVNNGPDRNFAADNHQKSGKNDRDWHVW